LLNDSGFWRQKELLRLGDLALPAAIGDKFHPFRDLLSVASMNENGYPSVKK